MIVRAESWPGESIALSIEEELDQRYGFPIRCSGLFYVLFGTCSGRRRQIFNPKSRRHGRRLSFLSVEHVLVSITGMVWGLIACPFGSPYLSFKRYRRGKPSTLPCRRLAMTEHIHGLDTLVQREVEYDAQNPPWRNLEQSSCPEHRWERLKFRCICSNPEAKAVQKLVA